MIRLLGISILILQLFFVFGLNILQAQSIERQTISSSGTSSYSNGTVIRQTIGQPYNTSTNYSNTISYRPGFQQPVYRTVIIRNNLSLKLFPNPTTDFVTIESSVSIKTARLSVFDNAGKLVYSDRVDEFKNYQLNCTGFVNGSYIVSISDNESNFFSARLIIQR